MAWGAVSDVVVPTKAHSMAGLWGGGFAELVESTAAPTLGALGQRTEIHEVEQVPRHSRSFCIHSPVTRLTFNILSAFSWREVNSVFKNYDQMVTKAENQKFMAVEHTTTRASCTHYPVTYGKGQKATSVPAGVSTKACRMSEREMIPTMLSASFTTTKRWTCKRGKYFICLI